MGLSSHRRIWLGLAAVLLGTLVCSVARREPAGVRPGGVGPSAEYRRVSAAPPSSGPEPDRTAAAIELEPQAGALDGPGRR